jgi:hypothetical protein
MTDQIRATPYIYLKAPSNLREVFEYLARHLEPPMYTIKTHP